MLPEKSAGMVGTHALSQKPFLGFSFFWFVSLPLNNHWWLFYIVFNFSSTATFHRLNRLFLLTYVHGRLLPSLFGCLSLVDHIWFILIWGTPGNLMQRCSLKCVCVCVCVFSETGHLNRLILKKIFLDYSTSYFCFYVCSFLIS